MAKSINCLTSNHSDENINANEGKRKLTRMQAAKGIINPTDESMVITAVGEVPYRLYRRFVSGRLLLGQSLQWPFLDEDELYRVMHFTNLAFEVILVKTPMIDVHPDMYPRVQECYGAVSYNEEVGVVVLHTVLVKEYHIERSMKAYRTEEGETFTELLGRILDLAHEHSILCYNYFLKDYGLDSKIIKRKHMKSHIKRLREQTEKYKRRRSRQWRTLLRKRQEEELYMNVCDAIFHRAPLQMFNTYRLDVEAFQEKMRHLKEDAAVDYIMALFALGYLTDSKDGAIKLVSEELRNKYLHMAPDILREVAKLR